MVAAFCNLLVTEANFYSDIKLALFLPDFDIYSNSWVIYWSNHCLHRLSGVSYVDVNKFECIAGGHSHHNKATGVLPFGPPMGVSGLPQWVTWRHIWGQGSCNNICASVTHCAPWTSHNWDSYQVSLIKCLGGMTMYNSSHTWGGGYVGQGKVCQGQFSAVSLTGNGSAGNPGLKSSTFGLTYISCGR